MGARPCKWTVRPKQRQLEGMFWNPDRAVRERAWSLMSQRQLQDRAAINAHWQQYMELRLQIAKNADKPDYRAYRWQLNQRFDYTPEDAKRFQDSIEKAVVPFTMRLAEKRRQRLGLNSLRYFDIYVDYRGGEALKPFATTEELESRMVNAFTHVDPDFGKNLQEMRAAGLLDTGNRLTRLPALTAPPSPGRASRSSSATRSASMMMCAPCCMRAGTPCMTRKRSNCAGTSGAPCQWNSTRWLPWRWKCWLARIWSRRKAVSTPNKKTPVPCWNNWN